MSFSVSLAGHIPDGSEIDKDDVTDAFGNFVRALRELGVEPSGQISGYEGGAQFLVAVADVEDIDDAAILDSSVEQPEVDDSAVGPSTDDGSVPPAGVGG